MANPNKFFLQGSGSLRDITSNNKGEFNIPVFTAVNEFTTDPTSPEYIGPLPFELTIKKKGFVPYKVNLYDKNGNYTPPGPIVLTPIKSTTASSLTLSEEEINEMSRSKITPEFFSQKRIDDLYKNLQKRLIVVLSNLVSEKFGVADPLGLVEKIKKYKENREERREEREERREERRENREERREERRENRSGKSYNRPNLPPESRDIAVSAFQAGMLNLISENVSGRDFCPPKPILDEIIQKKANFVRIINNTMSVIDSLTKFLGFTSGAITAFKIIYEFLKFNPTPLPPFVPLTVPSLNEEQKDKTDIVIEKSIAISTGILSSLVILRSVLTQALQLLELLDTLLESCYPEDLPQLEQLNINLDNLANESTSKNKTPIIPEVNGFTLEIETEITENPLKRKRAVAKNKGKIAVLKGEWSFSAIDQILIDELVFYIQTNNLKAD
jgi:hypothetical protein